MTRSCGSAFSSNGSAARPSSTGISMSSTTTSTGVRASSSIAARPLTARATTRIAGSLSSMRAIAPRIVSESSHTMTRTGVGESVAGGRARTARLTAGRPG